MYLDSAYVAKFYVNEPDAAAVRQLIRRADNVCFSSWTLLEVTSIFHRHVREGAPTVAQGRELMDVFMGHVESDLWNLIPVSLGDRPKTDPLPNRWRVKLIKSWSGRRFS